MEKKKEKAPKLKKQKLSGFDIVYKVVTAVMAIAVLPLSYFLSLVYVEIGSPGVINNVVGMFTGCDTNNVSSITYEKLSIQRLIELVQEIKSFMPASEENAGIWSYEHFRPAIISAGFLAFAVLIAIVIFVVIFFTRNEKVIMALSTTGLVSTIISAIIFTESFAAPIISREVSLTELFNLNSFLISILFSFIGRIVTLRLDIGFYSVMFLMLGILSWSFCVYIVNLEDKSKQTKKIDKSAKKSK